MATKRYFLEHYQDSIWARYLEVKEEDIEKVVGLAATVYVPKDDIENIEQYRIENNSLTKSQRRRKLCILRY